MCGISGMVRFGGGAADPAALFRMIAVQHHRGPDGCAYVEKGSVVLGHNRLRIIDLSPAATQPMTNEDGNLWVVFNGEIYNFRELRETLIGKGHHFKSRSDTETLLHLYEEEGSAMVDSLNGIFAFALLDQKANTLFLARDHFGVKPLYYSRGKDYLLFASESKALLAAGVDRSLDEDSLHETLLFSHCAGSRTLFRQIEKLLPGETMQVDTHTGQSRHHRFWRPRVTVENPTPDSVERIEHLLVEAVRRQMISDVPLGTMCSGGIDSSLITSMVARQNTGPLDTYVVRVDDPRFDETRYSELVSSQVGSRHHVLETESRHADTYLPLAIWLHDEPLMHENSIPILQISLMAKHQVTVLLSGEGADEVYGGYDTQTSFRKVHDLRRILPPFLAARLEPLAWRLARTRPARLLQRVGAVSLAESMALSASRASEGFLASAGWTLNRGWHARVQIAEEALAAAGDPVLAHILYDQQTYLQTLLDRQDKMSMGASIESRVPFLDVPTVSAANGMGMSIRHRDGENKWILRQIGRSYLPAEISGRKKHAFGLPLGTWMRGSELICSRIAALHRGHLVSSGLAPRKVIERITSHWDRGRNTLATLLWTLVNLEIWWDLFMERQSPPGMELLPSYETRHLVERVPNLATTVQAPGRNQVPAANAE